MVEMKLYNELEAEIIELPVDNIVPWAAIGAQLKLGHHSIKELAKMFEVKEEDIIEHAKMGLWIDEEKVPDKPNIPNEKIDIPFISERDQLRKSRRINDEILNLLEIATFSNNPHDEEVALHKLERLTGTTNVLDINAKVVATNAKIVATQRYISEVIADDDTNVNLAALLREALRRRDDENKRIADDFNTKSTDIFELARGGAVEK